MRYNAYMADFNRRGRPDRPRDFEKRSFKKREYGDRGSDRGDRGDRGDREMFSAVCAKCGNECKVPFRPTGNRPVYCSNCFEKTSEEGKPMRFDSRPPRFAGSSDAGPSKKQFDELNAKLDKILSLLSEATESNE